MANSAQVAAAGELTLESLCAHHLIDDFTCVSDEMYELLLDDYSRRSRQPYGDRVLVALDGLQVAGYLVAVDMELELPEDPESNGIFYYVSALAVGDKWRGRGSTVAAELVKRTLGVIDEIDALDARHRPRYEGILVSPLTNGDLERGVRNMGFKPVSGRSGYFVKPRT